MKTKILLWSVVFILATAFAAENTEPLQTISLSDGAKVTFLGITYGKHHVAPNYEAIGGHIQTGRWINRSNDVAVAWIEIEHNPTPAISSIYSLFVSDKADANGIGIHVDGPSINKVGDRLVEGFELGAYPRWDKQFYLSVYSTEPYSRRLSNEKFLVTNPDLRDIGNAVAEMLPVTKTSGDLMVTLTNLVSGAPRPPYLRLERHLPADPVRRPNPDPNDPISQCVRFGFDLKQNGHTATNWQLASVVVSDAVSNHVETTRHFQDNERARLAFPFATTPADNYKGYVFWPSLWPNEPAWNVSMEFTRDSGFNEDEIVTFTNLPVRQGTQWEHDEELSWNGTNFPFITEIAEKNVQGVRLKMLPPLVVPESQPDQQDLFVILYVDPDPRPAMKLTLIEATDGQGQNISAPFLIEWGGRFTPSWAGHYFIEFPNLHDVKTLNLKLALHRSRFVTFTVKPDRL